MKYLFLAVPNYCGSTVLHNYLAQCTAVASLYDLRFKNVGIVEGQSSIREEHFNRTFDAMKVLGVPSIYESVLKDESQYDWLPIKQAWEANWANSITERTAYKLQKSPTDVFRVEMVEKYFDDLRWIIMVRNPYAYVQAIIYQMIQARIDPVANFNSILFHVIHTLEVQKQNQDLLRHRAYSMTYESFVTDEAVHTDGLKSFLPELDDIKFSGKVFVKGAYYDGLVSNNDVHVAHLKNLKGALDRVTKYLAQHEDIIKYWGYELI